MPDEETRGLDASLDVVAQEAQELRLKLSGRLDTRAAGRIWARGAKRIAAARGSRVVVDATGLDYCDGGGAAMLAALKEDTLATGGSFELLGFPSAYEPILELVAQADAAALPATPPPKRGFVQLVGREVVATVGRLTELTTYAGKVAVALALAVAQPHKIRWGDSLRAMQQLGVSGFPVVFLINFLLGLILAYQTAASFHQYGADVYMADMLAISLVKELGPLMTAIMLAARSGSAFAAEIGTMKVNEEVDALVTMGLNPVRFLATPRMIAAVVMVPLLTVFADIAGLAGGAIVWVGDLDLPLSLYHKRVIDALTVGDFYGGLVKCTVFGVLVAAIGCIRGMQTRGGAIAVGISTTSSVVTGIISIALADMVFAIVFFQLGW